MEKILNFLKNKSVGYYIAATVALLSFILAIVFFATFSNPDVPTQMGNKAVGMTPQTIGIFLIAGFVVELVVLFVPQYRFVQLIAVVLFGLALYKEVLIIPDFIAGKVNNVEYNDGNFELNVFYLVSLLIIVIASIVPVFMGFYKKEEEAAADMPVKGKTKIIKVASSAVLVVAAVLASSLTVNALTKGTSKQNQSDNQAQSSSKNTKPKKDPINQRIKDAAEAVEYSFNPEAVLIKQQETYDYNNEDLTGLKYGNTRTGHDLVYVFEGVFSEGYQGGYGIHVATIYLWDDGLYAGKSKNTEFKGYWYNSSIDDGKEEGEDIADCLNMVSNQSNFKSIITDPVKGFYQRQGYVYINPGWGDRSVVVSGYKYYPDVAIFIDTYDKTTFKVGEVFNRDIDWEADRVIKNLTYTTIVEGDSASDRVQWTYPDGMLDENNKFTAAGEYKIKASWHGFEDEVTITVADAPAA
ncbi:MAG: hypothetical protein J5617_03255 [Bacilli bacterium]|nr:hypothetical protein [Bacilli bacterium]